MTISKRKTPKEFFNSFSKHENSSLYIVDYTRSFKKSVDLCYRRNLDLSLLENAIKILLTTGKLPSSYLPHPLKGFPQKKNEIVMECHIKPDWLLVWVQNDNKLTLLLADTGTHSDLF
jgi:mRNA interferase YafQ